MRASLTVVCIAMFASFMFTGCSKKESSNPVDQTGIDNPAIPGAPVSGAQRAVVIARMQTFIDSVLVVNPSGMNAALVKFYSTRPEFIKYGLSSDSSVYAVFTDGRLMIYSDNLKYDPSVPIPDLTPFTPKIETGMGKTRATLPALAHVYLMDIQTPASDQTYIALSTRWLNKSLANISLKAGLLTHALNATVNNLKTVKDAGLFHISTHGGMAQPSDAGNTVYSIMTAEAQNSRKDTTDYAVDLDTKRLTYFWAPGPPDARGRATIVCNYGFTPAFVKQYMTLAKNSLVVISACTSFDRDMVTAFTDAGASVYIGWDNVVLANISDPAAAFIFDRCLGTNLVTPIPNLPQRPFNWEFVLYDLDYRGYTVSRGAQVANMQYVQAGGDLRMLLPTIQYGIFYTNGTTQRMELNGDWGVVPGEILLNGAPLARVGAWNEKSVETVMPSGGGNIQVQVNGLKSNVVQLTEFSGTVTYVEAGPGSLRREITLNVKFIADIHKYRVVSGANAVYKDEAIYQMPRLIGMLASSSGSYTCGGSYQTSSNNKESWSGAGSFAVQGSVITGGAGGAGGGAIEDVGGKATMVFTGYAPCTITESSGSREELFSTGHGFNDPIVATVGPGFVLKAGSMTNTVGTSTHTLSWTDMTPKFLPDPKAAR